MGLVLDNNSVELYERWLRCPAGRAMDEFTLGIIHGLLSLQKNDRILDIGCGTGNHILSLKRLGLDISGIDASADMIDIARSRLGSKCELKIGQAEDLPFSDNEFDIALLINALEFIDDPLTVLKEAGRVARKKVLICVINRLSLYYQWARLGEIFRESLIKHIRPYNLWEMKSHIKSAYGAVPVVWKCTQDLLPLKGRHKTLNPDRFKSFNWPFGSFLGFSVTLNPLIRTGSLPLKIMVKKPEQPFAEGITTQGQYSLLDNDAAE